jgi:hypothetical protein
MWTARIPAVLVKGVLYVEMNARLLKALNALKDRSASCSRR